MPERVQHPWLNVDHPYIFRTALPKRTTDQELQEFLDTLFALSKQTDHRFAWIVDMTHIVSAPASQRRLYAENEKRVAAHNERYSVGTALVIESKWTRGVLTAVFWLQKPTYPYTIVRTLEEAEAWVLERLADAGIDTSL